MLQCGNILLQQMPKVRSALGNMFLKNIKKNNNDDDNVMKQTSVVKLK